jgi:hypothetical protein
MLNKIIWLASYPKSGNTYLRLLLTNYFYGNEGLNQFELIKKIPKFEKTDTFERALGKKINTENFEYIKNSLLVQDKLCKNLSIQDLFFKNSSFLWIFGRVIIYISKITKFFIFIVKKSTKKY